jgi:NADH-quinone oxidoreductase subunit N
MNEYLPTSAELMPFLPEILLVLATAAVLLAPMILRKQNILAVPIAATAGLGAAWLSLFYVRAWAVHGPASYFGGMLLQDPFSWAIKLMLIGFALVLMALWLTDSHDKFIARGMIPDTAEFFAMLLVATLGYCLMTATTHLLMLVVATEMASLPAYVLVGFRKGHRPGAEAGMKFVLLGGVAAALMVYGISLLYGLFGTLDLQEIAVALATKGWAARTGGMGGAVFVMGMLGLLAGIGFKIAMAPVHLWCPDVFEGASIDVTTFLSVASVTAGLAALLRVLLVLTGGAAAGPATSWIAAGMLVIGVATAFCGSLGAYTQTNIKRLLAWSSVMHAGFMLIGMCALILPGQQVLAPANHAPASALRPTMLGSPAAEALLFYLLMYLFMTGGAFIAAAAIAQRLTGPTDAGMSLGVDKIITALPSSPPEPTETGEDIQQYAGLWRRAPILAAIMLVFLLSLAGVPLTIGFGTKMKLFTMLLDVGAPMGWIAIAAVIINTVIAAFSYFRVIRQMYLTDSDSPRLIEIAPVSVVALVFVVPNLVLFVGYSLVDDQAQRHAEILAPAVRPMVERPAAVDVR